MLKIYTKCALLYVRYKFNINQWPKVNTLYFKRCYQGVDNISNLHCLKRILFKI